MPSPVTVAERRSLGEQAARWDELAAAAPLPSPFQQSWWLAAAEPTFLLVSRGEQLIGGLAVGRRRTLGVTRYGAPGPAVLCPDHLDVVAQEGGGDAVATAVADWFRRPGSRIVDMRGVSKGSLLERALGAPAAPDDVAPWQPLEPGGDFLAQRSAAFRRNVRRGRKRLAELGFEHRRVPVDGIPDALRRLRALHETRGDRGPLLAELDRIERAVVAGAARGEARVDVLASGDRVAAVSVAFVVAGRLSLYQVARSTDREHGSAGTVLLADVVEDAAAAGCHEVDLLRGDEDYKTSFADERRTLGRLRAAHGVRARVLLGVEDLARRARAAVSARRTSPA
jgi:CelD/BcsL family acetyltransferase involved in cellulose biosynthesis